jgi:hypothetical protein
MRNLRITIPVLALVALTGCLKTDTRHTLYLEPRGALSWVALQTDVRSDAGGAEAHDEEQAWLAAARLGDDPISLALRRLGGLRTETRVLREQRPFALWIESRFAAVDRMLERLLDGLALDPDVELRIDGDAALLSFAYRETGLEGDEALLALVDDGASHRFVLTAGRFTHALGFRLERDDTVAVLLPGEDAATDDDGRTRYELGWTVADDP